MQVNSFYKESKSKKKKKNKKKNSLEQGLEQVIFFNKESESKKKNYLIQIVNKKWDAFWRGEGDWGGGG